MLDSTGCSRSWRSRSAAGVAAIVAITILLAGCGSSGGSGGTGGGTASAGQKVMLTFWENYGTQQTLLGTAKNLIAAYEKLHPNVTIKMVSQPATNYFALLQASAISHTGPDLAVMWTGLYLPPYAGILANLRPYFPASELRNIESLQWGAQNFDSNQAILAAPVDAQFYMGFYNRKDFAAAGISSPPADWSQLFADCTKLKRIGVTPITYGSQSGAYTTEFNPWMSMSYLAIGAYRPSQWASLYNGSIPWTSAALTSQLNQWHQLYARGCVNTDALTDTSNLAQLVSGKAAMSLNDGSWDVAQLTQQMGPNVGAMVPPFSATPQKGVVYFPGDAISVMKDSPHVAQAAAFLAFMDSPAGAVQIAKGGLIPDIANYSSVNTLNEEMLAFVQKDHFTAYPMLDNVTQPNLVNAGYEVLPAALAGQASVTGALNTLAQKQAALPANQRSSYSAYFK
jgi:raffinose/stachyose/melibiose transport system substrate-binding protein